MIDGTLVNNGSISIEDGGTVVNHGTITRKTLPALTAPEVIAHTKTSVALGGYDRCAAVRLYDRRRQIVVGCR